MVELVFPGRTLTKPDDHDRTSKGDRLLPHNGKSIRIEVKSLQSGSVKRVGDDQWNGTFQCDASDCRPAKLPNGDVLKTTCLVLGAFDLLAVNLFEFGDKWRFAFVRPEDLPRSPCAKYTPEQRKHLLQTTPRITFPLRTPFQSEPWALLDAIVQEKAFGTR